MKISTPGAILVIDWCKPRKYAEQDTNCRTYGGKHKRLSDEPLFLMLNPFQTGIPTTFIMIFDM
jgi:hypothetical protein